MRPLSKAATSSMSGAAAEQPDERSAVEQSSHERRVCEECDKLRALFGDGADLALQRRIAHALDSLRLDEAMFLLDVQSQLYSVSY